MDNDVLAVLINGGSQVFDKSGILRFLPSSVNEISDSISTLLALKDATDIPVVRVTIETARYREK